MSSLMTTVAKRTGKGRYSQASARVPRRLRQLKRILPFAPGAPRHVHPPRPDDSSREPPCAAHRQVADGQEGAGQEGWLRLRKGGLRVRVQGWQQEARVRRLRLRQGRVWLRREGIGDPAHGHRLWLWQGVVQLQPDVSEGFVFGLWLRQGRLRVFGAARGRTSRRPGARAPALSRPRAVLGPTRQSNP